MCIWHSRWRCSQPIPEGLGLSSGSAPGPSFLLMAQLIMSLPPIWGPDPDLAVSCIWGVNQQITDLSLCISVPSKKIK